MNNSYDIVNLSTIKVFIRDNIIGETMLYNNCQYDL